MRGGCQQYMPLLLSERREAAEAGVQSHRLKADICFVYVVLCQNAAIFYECKTAFLALTPHAARCQERLFSPTCLHAGKVAFCRAESTREPSFQARERPRDEDRSCFLSPILDTPPFVLRLQEEKKICLDVVFLNQFQPEELINWKELD